MRPPAIDVRNVSYRYPDGTTALADINLRIEHGERVALLGPNGAGKTSLMLHLNGVHTPTTGEVVISGLATTKANLSAIRRLVGIVFQDPDDQLFMPRVGSDVAFGPANLGLKGDELDERVREALAAVGMADAVERVPHHLSGGEKRRVALATVLAMRPEVLVLDEPSSNLDPLARREFGDLVASLDTTVLLATHDLPYALELCPRSVIVSDGRIVADGPTATILADDTLLRRYRLELPRGFTVPSA